MCVPEGEGPAHLPVLEHQVGVTQQRVRVAVVQARELGVVVVPLDLRGQRTGPRRGRGQARQRAMGRLGEPSSSTATRPPRRLPARAIPAGGRDRRIGCPSMGSRAHGCPRGRRSHSRPAVGPCRCWARESTGTTRHRGQRPGQQPPDSTRWASPEIVVCDCAGLTKV